MIVRSAWEGIGEVAFGHEPETDSDATVSGWPPHDQRFRQSLPHLLRFVFLAAVFLAVPFFFAASDWETAFFVAAVPDETVFLVEPAP